MFNVGVDYRLLKVMFIKLTREVDDASVDMDFETIDKNELKQ